MVAASAVEPFQLTQLRLRLWLRLQLQLYRYWSGSPQFIAEQIWEKFNFLIYRGLFYSNT